MKELSHHPIGKFADLISFVRSVKSPEIVIETIKRSEDLKAVVFRFYETCRTHGRTKIKFGFPVKRAWRCNLLEVPYEALDCESNSVEISYKPYEIISLLVQY